LNDENIYRQQFLENRLLKIENIESFYNYSNPDNDFKLITSVLSDDISFQFADQTILGKKSKIKLNDHKKEFPNEITVPSVELNVELIKSKKKRIRSTILKNNAKKKKLENQDHEGDVELSKYINFFTSAPKTDMHHCLPETNVIAKSDYCYPLSISDKKNCKSCDNPCLYSIHDILNPKCSLSQTDILKELSFHKHPRSRILKTAEGGKRQRNTTEAARELADHYKFAHDQQEPYF
jgi:hypothetical protein